MSWISFTLGACTMFVFVMISDNAVEDQRSFNATLVKTLRESNAQKVQAQNMVLLLQERLAEEMNK